MGQGRCVSICSNRSEGYRTCDPSSTINVSSRTDWTTNVTTAVGTVSGSPVSAQLPAAARTTISGGSQTTGLPVSMEPLKSYGLCRNGSRTVSQGQRVWTEPCSMQTTGTTDVTTAVEPVSGMATSRSPGRTRQTALASTLPVSGSPETPESPLLRSSDLRSADMRSTQTDTDWMTETITTAATSTRSVKYTVSCGHGLTEFGPFDNATQACTFAIGKNELCHVSRSDRGIGAQVDPSATTPSGFLGLTQRALTYEEKLRRCLYNLS